MDYRTVREFGTDEFIERRSRFIGYATPVETEEEALAFVAEIKEKHRDASHNVSAFVLKNGVKRYSDDGEPKGTAGGRRPGAGLFPRGQAGAGRGGTGYDDALPGALAGFGLRALRKNHVSAAPVSGKGIGLGFRCGSAVAAVDAGEPFPTIRRAAAGNDSCHRDSPGGERAFCPFRGFFTGNLKKKEDFFSFYRIL